MESLGHLTNFGLNHLAMPQQLSPSAGKRGGQEPFDPISGIGNPKQCQLI